MEGSGPSVLKNEFLDQKQAAVVEGGCRLGHDGGACFRAFAVQQVGYPRHIKVGADGIVEDISRDKSNPAGKSEASHRLFGKRTGSR